MMRNLARLAGAGLFLLFGVTVLVLATSRLEKRTPLTMVPSDRWAVDLMISEVDYPLEKAFRLPEKAPLPATWQAVTQRGRPRPVFWALVVPFLSISIFRFWQRWELL